MNMLEEYLQNVNDMKMPLDDYGNQSSVRKHNRLADKNRKIASLIDKKYPEMKGRFICLLSSEDEDVRLWVAHHALEVMHFSPEDRQKALQVIKDAADHSQNEVVQYGNKLWLENFFKVHPKEQL